MTVGSTFGTNVAVAIASIAAIAPLVPTLATWPPVAPQPEHGPGGPSSVTVAQRIQSDLRLRPLPMSIVDTIQAAAHELGLELDAGVSARDKLWAISDELQLQYV